MDRPASISPKLLLLALFLGTLPALLAAALAPDLLQRWDLPIAAGVLAGGLLLATRKRAERVGEFQFAGGLALLIVLVAGSYMQLRMQVPATNDERALIYQAELFAEGRLSETLQVNPMVDFMLNRRQLLEHEGVRFAKYPPGPAFLLVPGVWLGWPGLMVILLAVFDLLLVVALAREYGLLRPQMAGLALAVSPFFLLVLSGFQSEFASLPFALGAWWALLRTRQGGWLAPVLVGACCGAVFLSRPLTGVIAALACGWGLVALHGMRAALPRLAAATLGGIPSLAILLTYQAAQTGDAWTAPYEIYAQKFGPWLDARVPAAERIPVDVYGQGDPVAGLGRQLTRWSVGLGMLGAFAVGLLGLWQLRRKDGGAALIFTLALPIAYAFHWYPGHWAYLGPLYNFEALGFVLIGFLAAASWMPPAWGKNLVLALLAWGAISAKPRFDLLLDEAQQRSAPERVAEQMQGPAVLLLPFVSVPKMLEYGMKHWTPSRHPAEERVAIVRELPQPEQTRRGLEALGLTGRPVFRLSPITDAEAGEADYEALPAPEFSAN